MNACIHKTVEEIREATKNRGIQLDVEQLYAIAEVVTPPMNLLVFGLGYDSSFWCELNDGGRTVFIEDNGAWFRHIKSRHTLLEAYLITFNTRRSQWKGLLKKPESLKLKLPREIYVGVWDVVLVDGPAGYADDTPGRMKSIYMASQLVRTDGAVFVHDAEREVEKVYCDRFLLRSNFVRETKGSKGALHHFKMANSTGLSRSSYCASRRRETAPTI